VFGTVCKETLLNLNPNIGFIMDIDLSHQIQQVAELPGIFINLYSSHNLSLVSKDTTIAPGILHGTRQNFSWHHAQPTNQCDCTATHPATRG
jgi:hypothetical protein